MSDERKKAKSKKVTEERHVEVAARLGMDPDEIAVFVNTDGEYAVIKDGTRVLLQDEGRVAWYGDKAPNPTYELVRPTVELDEAELDEVEAPVTPSPSDAEPLEPLQPDSPDAPSVPVDEPPAPPAAPAKPAPPAKATAAKK